MSDLIALLDDHEVGVVHQANGRLSFTYSDAWRAMSGAYPLSLSMPLAAKEHAHGAIEPFLWGLLPDNEYVLSRWAQKFQVSARNPFALLGHVGEDCAGAVQFITPERRELATETPSEPNWLNEGEVANRLRNLRNDASSGRMSSDTGQFSLAGAQPKTALLFDGQRWGVPSGWMPTTHILKPTTAEWNGHAENEHLCLALARALGLPVARSEVRYFEDVAAIVVTRYDRLRGPNGRTNRVHQEDFCQALRVHPANKYQNQGGPGPKQTAQILGDNSVPADQSIFVEALIFNWLIGGTDAHAKNYSLLIGGNGSVRLAPLYDIASILAYPKIDAADAKMAMKIGGTYRLRDIGMPEWRKFAAEMRVDEALLIDRIRAMARELPDRLADEILNMRQTGLLHNILNVLGQDLPVRAGQIAGKL